VSATLGPSDSEPLSRGLFQPLHIEQILITPRRALVDYQVLAAENRSLLIGEAGWHPLSPRLPKLHSVDRRDDGDSKGFDADLENQPESGKVGDGEILQGSAKIRQGSENTLGVAWCWSDPYIKVLGRANQAMCGQRVRANNEELNATSVECG
jgi:hypothetical protein